MVLIKEMDESESSLKCRK